MGLHYLTLKIICVTTQLMKLQAVLQENQFPENAIKEILSWGITDLYKPQADAIEKGVLDGRNLLMSVPTAAGKTLIAELVMLRSILLNQGRCLYIAPLKALASEKYNDFKKKYAALGIEVGLAIGDHDTPSQHLNRYQILVATAEKIDSLLRSKASWLIESLSVVVLDEIHFINDGSRGPTLEILTARIKQLNSKIQILALSATVSNAQEMADWLKGGLVLSNWRPIPLKEGVYYNDRIVFDGYGTRMVMEEEADDLSKLTLDTLRGKGQVLIFVNSRRSAQAVSRQVSESVAKILTSEERKELLALSKKIAGNSSDTTKVCRKLADVFVHGVAFHHAGLKANQRTIIEESFKKNIIKVISCTPTLAAGVNLPARRAIIRDTKRYESGVGQAFIPTSEYKQCAGRAGRPQYDDFGEAVLVAKSHSEMHTLFERYIQASPDPVISKLDDESALRTHILSSIAGGYVHDVKSMLDFIAHTFLYHQRQNTRLLDLISQIFDFLQKEKFIEKSGYRFFATTFGSLTSRLYIDPLTAIMIRNGLMNIDQNKPFSAIGMLHLITCCPDAALLNVGKSDLEAVELFASKFSSDFVFTPQNCDALEDMHAYLSTIKTTWMLSEWIEEGKEDLICDQFNIGPGDIYRHIEGNQWLLYGAGRIAQLFLKKDLTFKLENLRNRMAYGIKEELLPIIQLKGVGRIRARNLFQRGFKKLDDFKHTSVDQLAQIPAVGKALAQDILNQISNPVLVAR